MIDQEAPILSIEKLKSGMPRRKEWVTLAAGRCCVWELTMAEAMLINEQGARPRMDPRGGLDPAAAAAWQIIFSCYNGDDPEAKRIFTEADRDMAIIMDMPLEQFTLLIEAIARVNGKDAPTLDALDAFIGATRAAES